MQALRFLPDLVEHRLGKVEALFSLVGLGRVGTALALLVGHGLVAVLCHGHRRGGKRRYFSVSMQPARPALHPVATHWATACWPWLLRPERIDAHAAAVTLHGVAAI